ncbi:hypothetical protein TIFTF001_029019 [Ficus carica]|uniref:Uncharacterized protein n=1 Tax=Ficus carica TaxID=3494 RepID=A0AA88J0V1_FICCA|nr:hypothetical protein TIFTF001_029019 [Ficus carica]
MPRAYIMRFSKAISKVSGLDDGTVRKALKKGLRHMSLFKNEICAKYPQTFKDAMHRAKGFIDLEEENKRVEQKLARTRDEVTKASEECEERTTRHERLGLCYLAEEIARQSRVGKIGSDIRVTA